MHKVTFLLLSITLGLMMIGSLVTLGLLTGTIWLHIAALWLAVLLLIIFLGFYFRTYRRVMTRGGVTNERLAEMKILQERRYEQLAKRLDALSRGLNSQSGVGSVAGSLHEAPRLSDFEHLIARIEKAESRILGRLENIMLDSDEHFRSLEVKLDSGCSDHKAAE